MRKRVNKVQEDNSIDELLVNFKEEKPVAKYKVKVTHPSLRRRRAPNLSGEVTGYITDQGIYQIFDEANGWGKLEDGDWIMLSFTQIVN